MPIARANIKLPDGPVIVMGHSGAFRTIMQWVDHRLVEQIILLDAMYAGESAFDEFIETGKRADQHKLIVVAAGTAQELGELREEVQVRGRARKDAGVVRRFHQARARARSCSTSARSTSTCEIVTSGKVIPLLLRLTPLKAL